MLQKFKQIHAYLSEDGDVAVSRIAVSLLRALSRCGGAHGTESRKICSTGIDLLSFVIVVNCSCVIQEKCAVG